MSKNKVKILAYLVSICLIGCDQGYRIEVGPNNSNNPSTSETPIKSNESTSNSELELITEFENDAKESGRLLCRQRQAAESGNTTARRKAEAARMEFRDKFETKVKTKYQKFVSKPEFQEKWERYEEIGRYDEGCGD
jgi:hypothetical protein